jgi:hypothetical protein
VALDEMNTKSPFSKYGNGVVFDAGKKALSSWSNDTNGLVCLLLVSLVVHLLSFPLTGSCFDHKILCPALA